MKLGKIISPHFQSTFRKLMDAPLSGKTMFKLKGLAKKLQEESTKFDQVKKELVERFADKDESGNPKSTNNPDGTTTYSIGAEAGLQVQKELISVGETEIEISEVFKFEEVEGAKLTTADLLILDTLIQE